MVEQWKKDLLAIEKAGRTDIQHVLQLLISGQDVTLDIKKLKNTPYWRCRFGKWRIIYQKQGGVIKIIKIQTRDQVYKNL